VVLLDGILEPNGIVYLAGDVGGCVAAVYRHDNWLTIDRVERNDTFANRLSS
jgi:hypothetical protein